MRGEYSLQRASRDERDRDTVGSPHLQRRTTLARVTSTGTNLAVGKFAAAIPQAILGPESEGGTATFSDLGSAPIFVDQVGPGVPATGDRIIAHRVPYRWISRKKGTGGGGCTGEICVTVSGCNGYALQHALVTITLGGVTVASGYTDWTGKFCAPITAAGTYGVSASFPGSTTKSTTKVAVCGPNSVTLALNTTQAGSACYPCCANPFPNTLYLTLPDGDIVTMLKWPGFLAEDVGTLATYYGCSFKVAPSVSGGGLGGYTYGNNNIAFRWTLESCFVVGTNTLGWTLRCRYRGITGSDTVIIGGAPKTVTKLAKANSDCTFGSGSQMSDIVEILDAVDGTCDPLIATGDIVVQWQNLTDGTLHDYYNGPTSVLP
jgi:hypothetical protein